MRSTFFIIALFSLCIYGSSDAHASTLWASNAASCVPTPTSAANASFTSGAVTANASTVVVLYCRVDADALRGTTPLYLYMYYKGNKSVISPPASTSIELISMDKTTAVETSLGLVTGGSTTVIALGLVALTFTPDVDNNFYYVRATIKSGSTGSSVINTLYNITIAD